MKIYHYNDVGEYVGSGEADESPLEPGVYLIPRLTTEIEPPAVGANEAAVFDGSAWSEVPDFRGEEGWVDGVRFTITSLGDRPDGWSTSPPPGYNSATQHPPEWNGNEWIVRDLTAQEILDRLPPHFETSTGIKLATQEHDQTAFTRMLALIDLTQMDPAAMVIIKDAAGEKHAMSVADFKTIMAEYGAHCYTLHVGGVGA